MSEVLKAMLLEETVYRHRVVYRIATVSHTPSLPHTRYERTARTVALPYSPLYTVVPYPTLALYLLYIRTL